MPFTFEELKKRAQKWWEKRKESEQLNDFETQQKTKRAEEFLSMPWYRQIFTPEVAKEIPKATAKVTSKIADILVRPFIRTPIELGMKIGEKITGQKDVEYIPKSTIEKIIFGGKPLRAPRGTLETGLTAFGAIPVIPIGKVTPVKQVSKAVIKQIAKTGDEALIKNLVKETIPLIHDDILEKITPQLAKAKSVKRVKDILNKGLLEFMGRIELGKLTPEQLKEVATKRIKEAAKTKTPITEAIPLKAPGAKWEISERPALPPPVNQFVSNMAERIKGFIKEAEELIPYQKKIYSKERAVRAAAMREIEEKIKKGEISPEIGYYYQLSKLKGQLPHLPTIVARKYFTQEDINNLFRAIDTAENLTIYEKISAKTGLRKLLTGTLPAKSELEKLKQVFPEDFIKTFTEIPQKTSILEEVINIPRAIMVSSDLSAPFKQGIFLLGKPKLFFSAFKDMFKYAFSEKAYQGLMEDIVKRPTYKLMEKAGLALTDVDAPLILREEAYMGARLAERIPVFGKIIRGSDRAFVGFLNKLRADTFDAMVRDFTQLGYSMENEELLRGIASFINNATGRGDISGILARAQPLLNATFFSPRLMASRINLLWPGYYVKLPEPVRKEAIKTGLTTLSILGSILGLAMLAGAKVELDPRNADFAKIRIGNTRYDILGGFQQYIRLLAQLATRTIISSTTGKEIRLGEGYGKPSRLDILGRFFEMKTSPLFSLILDIIRGEQRSGAPVDIPSEIIDRFIPMLFSDFFDVIKEHGLFKGTVMGIPAIFGVGLQTYGTQELVEGMTELGQPTIEIRPLPTLSETISEKLFGKRPLTPSKEYNVQAYYQQLKQMPPEMAAAISREIKEKNPDLYKKLQKVAKEEKMGIGPKEKTLKSKGVKSGERALAIFEELKKLKTPEERASLYKSYKEKNIITPEVEKQLIELLRQEGFIK
jgi:hypothetical protein